jgi:hypothetical protein
MQSIWISDRQRFPGITKIKNGKSSQFFPLSIEFFLKPIEEGLSGQVKHGQARVACYSIELPERRGNVFLINTGLFHYPSNHHKSQNSTFRL